jgi:hypothetical protein
MRVPDKWTQSFLWTCERYGSGDAAFAAAACGSRSTVLYRARLAKNHLAEMQATGERNVGSQPSRGRAANPFPIFRKYSYCDLAARASAARRGPQRPRPASSRRRSGGHSVQSAPRACEEIHVQAGRENRDEEDAARMQGDDRLGCSPAARRATRHVQRACGRATKYPGKGVLHDFARGDAALRRT